jgi:hypothetical protein
MDQKQEEELQKELIKDEQGRNRDLYDYAGDALRDNGILPLSIWPESNQNVAAVIKGELEYDSLPMDETNEFHKGMGFWNSKISY